MDVQSIAISQLRSGDSVWPRFETNESRIALFAELLTSGVELPPIEVVAAEDGLYFVADGVHRIHAAVRAGRNDVEASVIDPQRGESPQACAYRRALETATRSALPLTTSERQAAVRRLASEQPDLSHRAIGRLVGVSHDTVDRWLRQSDTESETDPQRDAPEGPLVPTADQVARRLVNSIARLEDSRGLADLLIPSRMGSHLAEAFAARYAEQALKEARRFAAWAARAVAVLETAEGAKR